MAHFIIERNVGSLTSDQLQAAGRLSNAVLSEMPDVVWVKSYVSDAAGKIYCEYSAPNMEAVMEHARRSGIPAHKISEVSLEISPAMFM